MKLKNVSIKTGGSGLWSHEKKDVPITSILCMDYEDDESLFVYIRVYFDTKVWDVEEHGLIYTDEKWLRELKSYLKVEGFSDKSVRSLNYTEQGMQEDDYVSLYAKRVFVEDYYKWVERKKEKK